MAGKPTVTCNWLLSSKSDNLHLSAVTEKGEIWTNVDCIKVVSAGDNYRNDDRRCKTPLSNNGCFQDSNTCLSSPQPSSIFRFVPTLSHPRKDCRFHWIGLRQVIWGKNYAISQVET
ncbi:uncharacterized protein LOC127807540 [Diospyros lotus]|uniref:uncharacterized protein LOC127807540 n=1 Tax=Diospyros lotus TaxID=55363 RepID=UPI00225502C8|nr:uncharacterized protein LOC127807540 [Diospyros lotus]